MKAILQRPLCTQDLRDVREDFYVASKPFIKLKTDIMNTAIPKIRIVDGKLEREYSKEFKTATENIDKMLAVLKEQIIRRIT